MNTGSFVVVIIINFLLHILKCMKEFEESGDPEKHFQELLALAKEGVEKGKVSITFLCFVQKLEDL